MQDCRFTIVGVGEALVDVFPDKEVLGGAPLNVAIHAHQLGQVRGGCGAIVSRVGQDALGRRVIDEVRGRGLDASYLQTDPDRRTGEVIVDLDDQGQPTYDIIEGVAWDVLQFDPDTEELATRAQAVCFGTLAQRDAQARNTIYRFLDTARRAVRLFDVNLRQSYYDAQILQRSCEYATALKLNREELPIVAKALGVYVGTKRGTDAPGNGGETGAEDQSAQEICRRFDLKHVVLTRGQAGTVIYTPTQRIEGEPVSYPAAADADAVGAGDACSAAVLVGLVVRRPLEQVVHLANHAGAYVASQPGATPTLPDEVLGLLR